MRRRLFTLAIFLLLGAIVNVAVAWGLVIHYVHFDIYPQFQDDAAGHFPRGQPEWETWIAWRHGMFLVSSHSLRGASPEWSTYLGGKPPNDDLLPGWATARDLAAHESMPEEEGFYRDVAWGWPVWALRSRLAIRWLPTNIIGDAPVEVAYVEGGIVTHYLWTDDAYLWTDGGEPFALPLVPIWPGFAVNTVFYAAILWLPIRGPFVLRRHIRRKRGLCVSCGYDLRHADHDACPECGYTSRRRTPL